MAASSLLALIDDIATILDDVALMTKVAAKKRLVYWVMIWL
jgi:predicted DNA repair protein MutK